jgi:hypothetical protein
MTRRLELVSALLACTLALMVVFSATAAFSASYAAGMPGQGVGESQRDLALMVLLFAGVAAGAYLHVVYRFVVGLALLWVCTALILVGAAYIVLVPQALLSISPLLGLELTGWASSLIALAFMCAVVSAVTAITPIRPRARPRLEEEGAPAPRPSFLSRLFPQ